MQLCLTPRCDHLVASACQGMPLLGCAQEGTYVSLQHVIQASIHLPQKQAQPAHNSLRLHLPMSHSLKAVYRVCCVQCDWACCHLGFQSESCRMTELTEGKSVPKPQADVFINSKADLHRQARAFAEVACSLHQNKLLLCVPAAAELCLGIQ